MTPLAKGLTIAGVQAALVIGLAVRAATEVDDWARATTDAIVQRHQTRYASVSLEPVRIGFPSNVHWGRCNPEIRDGELVCVYDPRNGKYILQRHFRLHVPPEVRMPDVGTHVRIEVAISPEGQIRPLRLIGESQRQSSPNRPRR